MKQVEKSGKEPRGCSGMLGLLIQALWQQKSRLFSLGTIKVW